MKTHPITLLPPAPATRREIAAFHLRERRLRALLAVLVSLVLAVVCALLCQASTDRLVRALLFGLVCTSAGAAGIYAYEVEAAHRTLKRTEEDAR